MTLISWLWNQLCVSVQESANEATKSDTRYSLISIAEHGDLVVEDGQLDMAVTLLLDSVQGANLILASVPVKG
jgi:hypothetical protein